MWVIYALLHPDPDSQSGYGSGDPIESGSNPYPDPDPKHCSEGVPLDFNFLKKQKLPDNLGERPGVEVLYAGHALLLHPGGQAPPTRPVGGALARFTNHQAT